MNLNKYLEDALRAVEEIKKDPTQEKCPQCYAILELLYNGTGTESNPKPMSSNYVSMEKLLGIKFKGESTLSTPIVVAMLEEGGFIDRDKKTMYESIYSLTDKGMEFMKNSKNTQTSS